MDVEDHAPSVIPTDRPPDSSLLGGGVVLSAPPPSMTIVEGSARLKDP